MGAAQARERQIEQQQIMLRLALAFSMQAGQNNRDKKPIAAPTPIAELSPLTPQERWLVDHRGWVKATSLAVVLLLVVSVSLLVPWWIYRACRPAAAACGH